MSCLKRFQSRLNLCVHCFPTHPQILQYHIITGVNLQGTGYDYADLSFLKMEKNKSFTTPTMAGEDKLLTFSTVPKKHIYSGRDRFGMLKINAVGNSAIVQHTDWFYGNLIQGGKSIIHVIDAVLLPFALA